MKLAELVEKEPLVKVALEYATKCHEAQTRFDGTPYIAHPMRVAEALAIRGAYTSQIVAALLHDVVEDCGVTQKEILTKFGYEVFAIVVALTKQEGEEYAAFIERVNTNPLARIVKIFDILDNLIDSPSKNQVKKYAAALKVLV